MPLKGAGAKAVMLKTGAAVNPDEAHLLLCCLVPNRPRTGAGPGPSVVDPCSKSNTWDIRQASLLPPTF